MQKSQKEKIYSKIEELCNSFYLSKGFNFKRKIFSYEFEGFFVSLIATSEYPDKLIIQPFFILEHKEINVILKKVFPQMFRYFSSQRTQGLNFAHEFNVNEFDNSPYNFKGEVDIEYSTYSYEIEECTNLEPIIADHIAFMDKVGLKYYNKLKTIEGLNEFFNKRVLDLEECDFSKEEIIDSFQKEEVLSAIVAAHLTKAPNFEIIVEQYKSLYLNNDWYLNDIRKLAEYLT